MILDIENYCVNITGVLLTGIVSISALVAYYLYIDSQIRMLTKTPEKANKITVRVLAAGFTLAYGAMLIPTAKETLDFHVYTISIELYAIVRMVLFLGMIGFGLITGGTFLSNIKGNGRD